MAYVDVLPKPASFSMFPDRIQKLILALVSSAGAAVDVHAWFSLTLQIGPIASLNAPVQEIDITSSVAFATPNNIVTLTQAMMDATLFANNVGNISVPYQISGVPLTGGENQVLAYGTMSFANNPT